MLRINARNGRKMGRLQVSNQKFIHDIDLDWIAGKKPAEITLKSLSVYSSRIKKVVDYKQN